MKKRLFCSLMLPLALLLATGSARAEKVPTQQEMIDALTAPPPMRTRGLRNLKIVQTAADSAPAAAAPAPAPEPAASEQAAAVEEAPSLSLSINFDFNSTTIRPDSAQALANLAGALRSPRLQGGKFLIEGHTDAKGRADYNLKLSARRADAVRARLVQLGVPALGLETAGRGSTQLADPEHPEADANRRVRIVALH